VSCALGSPVADTVAVLLILLPVQAAAGAPPTLLVFTTTVLVCPLARLPNGQLRTWVAGLIVHTPPGFVVTVQVKPPVVGSGSLSVTFCAVPGPLLDTTIVKVSCPPILNVAFFGFLVMLMLGQLTVILAVELLLLLLRSLIEETVAVLLIAGQLAVVVVASSVIFLDVLTAIVPKLQVSVLPPASVKGCIGLQAGAASAPLMVQVSPLFGKVSDNTTLNESTRQKVTLGIHVGHEAGGCASIFHKYSVQGSVKEDSGSEVASTVSIFVGFQSSISKSCATMREPGLRRCNLGRIWLLNHLNI
jgi:hypothetical protein